MFPLASGPILLSDLLQAKALKPLSDEAKAELVRLAALSVIDYSEADVREAIIVPLLRLIGYLDGTDFDIKRERTFYYLNQARRIDYRLTLWKENFWIIEAKKPQFNQPSFTYEEFGQALEYAVHPQINAALILICDGLKVEVFDREFSVGEPLLRVSIKDLPRDIDQLRILLEPWQSWFFEKRRIVRMIGKVFDKEYNLNRLDEFGQLVEELLWQKRPMVLDNYRAQLKNTDSAYFAKDTPIEDLVNGYMLAPMRNDHLNAVVARLVEECKRNAFPVLYKFFPDEPRAATDEFHWHSLYFLMSLHRDVKTVHWMPEWLCRAQDGEKDRKVELAIQRLIALCLTCFRDDEPRKIVLLAYAAFRRIRKLQSVSDERVWLQGDLMHVFTRYMGDELSWGQIISSPAGQRVHSLHGTSIYMTQRYVRDCIGQQRKFMVNVAKIKLQELWKLEKQLLATVPNFRQLLRERDWGEITSSEYHALVYDQLAYGTLTVLSRFPEWMDYARQQYASELKLLMEKFRIRSNWEESPLLTSPEQEPLDEDFMAERFFFGDAATWRALKSGYTGFR